jgi:hypothetical protein
VDRQPKTTRYCGKAFEDVAPLSLRFTLVRNEATQTVLGVGLSLGRADPGRLTTAWLLRLLIARR